MQLIVTVLRLGLIWTALWAVVGAALSLIMGILHPPSIDPGEGPLDIAKILGGVGAISGLLFGLLIVAAERHRALADVPLLRAVFWGVLAGAAPPLLTAMNDVIVYNTGPLGALSAAFCVALGRLVRRSTLRSVELTLPQ